jgi:tripartite-type tricarboxylate transporter receptor subunit TctC
MRLAILRVRRSPVFGLLVLTLCGASSVARAQEYYSGKTITLVVGSAAGGGYDIYARTISRHLPRHLPGGPAIIVQNMPGASSIRAAAYLYNIAAKDGTVIGGIAPGAIVGPLLEGKADGLYDPVKFHYLATANNSTRVCAVHAGSKTASFAQALQQETIIGSTAEGGSTRDYAYLHKNTSGAKFRIVGGYKGTPDVLLAMERGELDGICGLDWSSLRAQKADDIRSGQLRILVQGGLEPNDELTRMGVPMVWEFMNTPEDRQVAELVIAQQLFGRPYVAPPGVAANIVGILRASFEATLQDPGFAADAAKTRIDIAPAGGERVQQGVERIYAAPRAIVQRARDAIRQ